MAGPAIAGNIESYKYHDTVNSGVNPIAPYQCVSLLTASQLGSVAGAKAGESARPAPASGTTFLDRCIGISEGASRHGRDLAVRTDGIAHVMAGAAVAYGQPVFPALVEQRSNDVAPLIDLFELNLTVEPGLGITYNVSMVDDSAVSPQSTSANVLFLPVGYALEAADAKYQLIRVKLMLAPFYA